MVVVVIVIIIIKINIIITTTNFLQKLNLKLLLSLFIKQVGHTKRSCYLWLLLET
jgi:hypothetical protein